MGTGASLKMKQNQERELQEFLKEQFGKVHVKVSGKFLVDMHAQVRLPLLPDADLSFWPSGTTGDGMAELCAWRNNEDSLRVLRAVANKFGGMLQEDDTTSTWEEFFPSEREV